MLFCSVLSLYSILSSKGLDKQTSNKAERGEKEKWHLASSTYGERTRKIIKKIPDNALKNNQLHHEALSEVSIHGIEQRDAHDQSVWQSGEREESDEPVQPSLKQDSPHGQQHKNQQLRESVCNYKLGVHLIWVVLRYEVEGKNRNGKHRNEPVNAGALLRREYLAPFHWPICNQHCKIQWNHCTHDLVEIICTDHFLSSSTSFLSLGGLRWLGYVFI